MAVLLGLAAINTGNNLLYLLESALLGLLVASGLLGIINTTGLQVEVRLPEEIYSGRTAQGRLLVHNRKKHVPSFMLNLRLGNVRGALSLLPPGSTTGISLPVLFHRRGRQTLPSISVESSFPVSFFTRSISHFSSVERVIYPGPRKCQDAFDIRQRTRKGELAGRGRGTAGELLQILDYTGREPMKQIHWKLSARQDQLKVKDSGARGEDPLILDIASLPGRTLEERLGSGSYLVNRYLRNRRPVGLRLGGRLIAPSLSGRHRHKLLTELALHDPG